MLSLSLSLSLSPPNDSSKVTGLTKKSLGMPCVYCTFAQSLFPLIFEHICLEKVAASILSFWINHDMAMSTIIVYKFIWQFQPNLINSFENEWGSINVEVVLPYHSLFFKS